MHTLRCAILGKRTIFKLVIPFCICILVCFSLFFGVPSRSAFAQSSTKYVGTGDLIWDYHDSFIGVVVNNACNLQGVNVVLELLGDGTFTLLLDNIQNYPDIVYTGGKVNCNYGPTGRLLFTGTYSTNPNQLNFQLLQQKIPVDSGSGSFNETIASGTVSAPGDFNGNSKTIHLTFNLNIVQTAAQIPPTETALPGSFCIPIVHGLDTLKPGDVLSPGATYYDASAKVTGIIQERWYINGIETLSTIWDGKDTNLELQYTCLDHTAHVQYYKIAAYSGQPSAPSGNPPISPGGLSPLGKIAAIAAIIGLLGVIGTVAGVVIKNASKNSKNPVPPPTYSGSSAPPAPPTRIAPPDPFNPPIPPASIAPPAPIYPPIPPPVVSSIFPPVVQPNKPELINIRNEMGAEVDRLKEQWKRTRDAVDKLTTLKKKNMIKFLVKQGFETKEWIMDSPVEVISKFTIDPLLGQVMGKHDTSQDGAIIVQINNRIQSLKAEMQQMTDQVRYLNNEISKINRQIAK